jgi:hypothetical protein
LADLRLRGKIATVVQKTGGFCFMEIQFPLSLDKIKKHLVISWNTPRFDFHTTDESKAALNSSKNQSWNGIVKNSVYDTAF